MEDGSWRVLVEGRRRVAIRRFVTDMGSYQADIEDAGEGPVVEATELVQSTLKHFERYAAANDIRMPKGWPSPEQARDPGRIADVIAMHIALWLKDRQGLLATLDPVTRLQHVHDLLGSPSIPLSPAFEATRRRAMASATQRNHRYATLEHLLLALIDDADASAVLRACNADLAALKVDLLGFLGSERENLFVEPGTEAKPSPAFRRVGPPGPAQGAGAGPLCGDRRGCPHGAVPRNAQPRGTPARQARRVLGAGGRRRRSQRRHGRLSGAHDGLFVQAGIAST